MGNCTTPPWDNGLHGLSEQKNSSQQTQITLDRAERVAPSRIACIKRFIPSWLCFVHHTTLIHIIMFVQEKSPVNSVMCYGDNHGVNAGGEC